MLPSCYDLDARAYFTCLPFCDKPKYPDSKRTTNRTQIQWVCLLCRKKQELLSQTGHWIGKPNHMAMQRMESQIVSVTCTSFENPRPLLRTFSSHSAPNNNKTTKQIDRDWCAPAALRKKRTNHCSVWAANCDANSHSKIRTAVAAVEHQSLPLDA